MSLPVPADIVFIVKDKQHSRFRREGTNLIHVAKIPLGKALIGTTIEIQTLDDRILHIPINDIVRCVVLNYVKLMKLIIIR